MGPFVQRVQAGLASYIPLSLKWTFLVHGVSTSILTKKMVINPIICDLHSLGSASACAAGVGSSEVVASEPSEAGSSVAAAVGILCPWCRCWLSSSAWGSSRAVEWG